MTPSVYLCEAAGFFVQFFPCALLCFLSFDRDRLRVSPWLLYPVLTLATLAVSAVFPLVQHGPRWEGFLKFDAIGNFYMLAAILLGVAAYALLVRENRTKKMMVVYVVLLYATAVYWLTNAFAVAMPDWNGGVYAYSPNVLLSLIALHVTLFPLLCVFMRKMVADFLREIAPENIRLESRFATFSTAAFLALMTMGDSMHIQYGSGLFFLFLFLLLNQALFFWMLFSNAILRTRAENTRRVLEAQKLQYNNITGDMDRAARQRHDMRHHYNYLYTLAQNGSREELMEYLSSLVSQTEFRENEVFCEDPTVNALLQYYVGKARDENIVCEVAAGCGVLWVRPEDLTVLIGNTLENAITSCRKAGGGSIDAAIGLVHGALTVVVTNSCLGINLAPGFSAGTGYLPAAAFLSSRDGGGTGLESIDVVAKKYAGSAAFKFDEAAHTFTSRIILNRA